mmetsp:Transcript_14685/g.43481  ORF Transcript_14685/g.43481 Transcript_14685/m.43481 type:complete len:240 (+) Transcript_14685:174-893(+)
MCSWRSLRPPRRMVCMWCSASPYSGCWWIGRFWRLGWRSPPCRGVVLVSPCSGRPWASRLQPAAEGEASKIFAGRSKTIRAAPLRRMLTDTCASASIPGFRNDPHLGARCWKLKGPKQWTSWTACSAGSRWTCPFGRRYSGVRGSSSSPTSPRKPRGISRSRDLTRSRLLPRYRDTGRPLCGSRSAGRRVQVPLQPLVLARALPPPLLQPLRAPSPPPEERDGSTREPSSRPEEPSKAA